MQSVNEMMVQKLEYQDQEHIAGKLRFEDLLTKGSRIFYKTHFHPILMAEKSVDEIVLSFQTANEKTIPVLLNMRVTGEHGEEVIYGTALPVAKRNTYERSILQAKEAAEKALEENAVLTEIKKKLQKSQALLELQLQSLERINHEQQEFNKILAHDLQEPLRKMQVLASWLDENSDLTTANPKARKYLDRLIEIAAYNHRLVNRLHGLHALEYEPMECETWQLEEVLNAALEKFESEQLEVDLDELLTSTIYGDKHKLIMLFIELFRNAHENKSAERALKIAVTATPVKENYFHSLKGVYHFMEYTRITVSDNALGFPFYSDKQVFQPLMQIRATQGIGLGLAYCKKIVELHQGRISLKPRKGGGSEFTILLPACKMSFEL